MDSVDDWLHAAEETLRQATMAVLGDAWQSAPGAPSADSLRQRRANDAKNRPSAVLGVPDITYTYTKELVAIVLADPSQFWAIFSDEQTLRAALNWIECVRNTIAHGRPLVPFERHLVQGYSEYLQAAYTRYRMNQANEDSDYPRIISVQDNLGRAALAGEHDPPPMLVKDDNSGQRAVVNVGDRLSFDCEGFDYYGRELEWVATFQSAYVPLWAEAKQGKNLTLSYQVTAADFGQWQSLKVYMRVVDKYHRFGPSAYDDVRHFNYLVRPLINGMTPEVATNAYDLPHS